jgi:hypothetical protein
MRSKAQLAAKGRYRLEKSDHQTVAGALGQIIIESTRSSLKLVISRRFPYAASEM